MEKRFAAVMIRGSVGLKTSLKETISSLRLYRRNTCVVIADTATNVGMLKAAKDYITWGEIDEDTFKLLVEKRGEEFKGEEQDPKGIIKNNDFVVINGKKIKKFFRLFF